MDKVQIKNLLVFGSIIVVIQNITLILILMIAFLIPDILSWALCAAFWLDTIGFAIIGIGMYYLGNFYSSVATYSQRAAIVAFIWVILSALWRLIFGMWPVPEVYILGTPDIDSLGIYVTVPPLIFGIAGVALLLLMIFINQVMNTFREQEGIGKGGSGLFTAYGIVHIIGVALIVIGWAPMANIVLNPDGAMADIDALQTALGGLLLVFLGIIIKIIVIPIIGIITFLGVRNSFQSIED